MKFAIMETGGKQYRVAEGDVLSIERLSNAPGEKVVFDKVLLMDDGTTTTVGTPYIAGASIEASVVKEGRGTKIHIQKYKAKSRYKRRIGHRQQYSTVSVATLK